MKFLLIFLHAFQYKSLQAYILKNLYPSVFLVIKLSSYDLHFSTLFLLNIC
jgi:hypothetical protein